MQARGGLCQGHRYVITDMFVILDDPSEDYQDDRIEEHQHTYQEYHPFGSIAHPRYMGKFVGQGAPELFPVKGLYQSGGQQLPHVFWSPR